MIGKILEIDGVTYKVVNGGSPEATGYTSKLMQTYFSKYSGSDDEQRELYLDEYLDLVPVNNTTKDKTMTKQDRLNLAGECAEFISEDLCNLSLDSSTDRSIATALLCKWLEEREDER